MNMKQIMTLSKLTEYAKDVGPVKLSVACAEDAEVIASVEIARKLGIANAILVGNADKIKEAASSINVNISDYEVVDERGDVYSVALKAVSLVSGGQAQVFMKGMLDTKSFLRAVLNKEVGLRDGKRVLTHCYFHEIKGYDRIIFITDPAFNQYPDLNTKVDIVNNAVELARGFGIECPKVAALAAVEVVNPDMPSTLDAAALTVMNKRGQIKGCLVDGPLALDIAISPSAANHKGIVSDVAGYADILLVPNIEAGNVLGKSIIYFSENKTAALVLGGLSPIVLTSRADCAETKLYSISAAVALAANKQR